MSLSRIFNARNLTSCAIATATLSALAIARPAAAITHHFSWNQSENVLEGYGNEWCIQQGFPCFKDDDQPIWVNNRIGTYEEISTTYNSETGDLSWSSTFEAYNGNLPNGAWLVINNGPNPRNDDFENAIFYLDGASGRLTSYVYNDENNSDSWRQEEFLQGWDDVVEVVDDGNKRTLSFNVNVSDINDRDDLGSNWLGAQFDEKRWYLVPCRTKSQCHLRRRWRADPFQRPHQLVRYRISGNGNRYLQSRLGRYGVGAGTRFKLVGLRCLECWLRPAPQALERAANRSNDFSKTSSKSQLSFGVAVFTLAPIL